MSTEAIQVSPELRRGRNRLAVTVILGHAIKHIYNSALQTILLPEIKIGLGLSATQFGVLVFSRQVTSWVTTIGAGYLGDRFANRASLILGISLLLMGVSYFALGSAPNYWVMFLAMLLVGIGPSLYHPPAIGALSRRFPDKRGFAISLHGTGGSVGEVLGPITAAGLLTFLMWRDVLHVSLFPALLGAFLIWSMMRSVPGGQVEGSTSTRAYLVSLASLLKKRALLVLFIVTAFRSVGQSSITIFLPVYLREDLAFSPTKVAIYLSLAQLVGVGSQPLMGLVSDRFGRKVVLVPAMIGMALLFIALAFAGDGVQLVITIIAMGTVLYSLHTIFIAAAMDVAGGEVQSTVVSLIYGASFLGTLSPIIAGIIADNFGVPSVFIFGGSVVLLGAVILLALKLPETANQMARHREAGGG
ncbi:MAG: MFS transporter [Chloroflexi bacterium]|nr:MFS transporter [Chloroflexota bacterium]